MSRLAEWTIVAHHEGRLINAGYSWSEGHSTNRWAICLHKRIRAFYNNSSHFVVLLFVFLERQELSACLVREAEGTCCRISLSLLL